MEKICSQGRWALANSTENAVGLREDDGGEEVEDDEALSLSDLPLIHHQSGQEKEDEAGSLPRRGTQAQGDFDFCSLSKESEMCAADEVFFQGQILPFRHSLSSEKGLLRYCDIRRSESMDHRHSGGFISSRSSSISSHQSSSSGSSDPKYKPRLPLRNQFHSHPSPSPRLRLPSNRQGVIGTSKRNISKKSSLWNIFRVGLVTPPPEIALQDLKTRCPSGKNLGSRNSTSSSSSSTSNKKKKARSLLGGCKCSSNAVETVPSKVVTIRRSASESPAEALQLEQDNVELLRSPLLTTRPAARKHLSHHRTFEWLKQLSLEGAPDEA